MISTPWIAGMFTDKIWRMSTHVKNLATAVHKGDTKDFKGKTFHYCDTPTHRDRAKWHTHAASDCSIRMKRLRKEDKDGASGSNPTEANANEVTEEDANSDDENDEKTQ